MFGIGIVELAIGLGVVFLLEIVLFWAAAAVADAPPMGWGKLLVVVLVVTAVSVALVGTLGHYSGATTAPLDPDNRPLALITAGLGLVALWAVPAVLYPFLASVSIPRGMWLSLLQLLLRGFLYAFLAAVFMVGLAVYQIATQTETRPEKVELSRPAAPFAARP